MRIMFENSQSDILTSKKERISHFLRVTQNNISETDRAEKPNIGIRNLLIKSYWCVQSLGIFVPS